MPRRLVGRETEVGLIPARIAPVFRDREELPTATDLGHVVNAALERSDALIVICSPSAAQSRWVNEEIRMFQRLGRDQRIFCLIVAGAPEAVDAEQCFPSTLRTAPIDGPSFEPMAADIRPGKDRPNLALVKIIAGLLGVSLDELVRRELQRRNRRLVGIAAVSITGMSIAIVLAAFALIARNGEQQQRARAEAEAATARQTSEFLVRIFQIADPGASRGATITAREILDRGASRIDRDLADQPVIRANLLQTMGRVYTGLGLYQTATDLLQQALALRTELTSKPTPDIVATANALGAALTLKGQYDAAERVYRDALSGAQTLYPEGDAQVTEAMNGIGDVLASNNDLAGAEAEYSAALAIDRRLHGSGHPDVARSLTGLATVFMYEKRYAESEKAFREVLAIRRETLGNDHPLVAETLNNLAGLLYYSGHPEEAEPLWREDIGRYRAIFGDEHPFVAATLNNLGRLLLERGELTEAERLLTQAVAIDRKLLGPDHDDRVYTLNNLGLVWLALDKDDQALPLFEEARRIAEEHSHRMLGQVLTNLAEAYRRAGRTADALAAIELARPLIAEEHAGDPWYAADLASIEGAALVAAGRLDEAAPLLLDSYEVIAAKWGSSGLFSRLAATRTAMLYDARGDSAGAERYRNAATLGSGH